MPREQTSPPVPLSIDGEGVFNTDGIPIPPRSVSNPRKLSPPSPSMERGTGGEVFLLLALVLPLAIGCQPEAKPTVAEGAAAVPVTVAAVGEKTVRRTIPVTGTLNAFEDITLSPKVDGQIVAAKFDIGDVVKPGDVLLELDATDYELNVRLAESEVAVQQSMVFEAEAQVKVAEATLVNARQELERYKTTGSQSEKDAAKAREQVAAANVESAKSGVQAAAATLEVKKRSLAIAEQRLRDAKLRVPVPPSSMTGKEAVQYQVAAKMVSVGEMTRSFPGTDAYRLVVTHTLKLKVTVPEKYTPDVRGGQAVEVRVDSHPDTTFPGTVARISPAIDLKTRTFQVEIEVPNADGRLKPGGFARADLVVGSDKTAVVPPAALVVFAGVSKVFVADGDTARAVPVEVGDRGPDWLEVRGGLKPGEVVITSGFTQVYDGAAISIRK